MQIFLSAAGTCVCKQARWIDPLEQCDETRHWYRRGRDSPLENNLATRRIYMLRDYASDWRHPEISRRHRGQAQIGDPERAQVQGRCLPYRIRSRAQKVGTLRVF